MNHSHTPLTEDASLVAALGATAMPFARSAEAQAESWIRTMRLHGSVGSAMQALGVGEAPLRPDHESTPVPEGDVSVRVVARAHELATSEGADRTGTYHLLGALFEIYGGAMDRALELHGVSRQELLQRVDEVAAHAEVS